MNYQIIEKLLCYAQHHLYLEKGDVVYKRNQLLALFKIDTYLEEEINRDLIKKMTSPEELIKELKQFLLDNNLEEPVRLELLVDKVMGMLTLPPSQVQKMFMDRYHKNARSACDYLYKLQIANNYIKLNAVMKNLFWTDFRRTNRIDISINLAKPEKDNKEIAKLRTANRQKNQYPRCMLCYDNVGYAGHDDYPPRNTLRMVTLKLDKDDYFLQYSPYVYYNEHCIIVDMKHQDMAMNRQKFVRMLDFVDHFPHYFIGSNSELPIVGGSILNHEHFQGGAYLMPMMEATPRFSFISKKHEGVAIDYLDWYNSVIRLRGASIKPVLDLGEKILKEFKQYTDLDIDLVAKTDDVEHSTITPIATKTDGKYNLYFILRNNRCNDEHPDGMFHAHRQYHHIKKEGIGLIEAMGLFILPPRLAKAIDLIMEILQGKKSFDIIVKNNPDFAIYEKMVKKLIMDNEQPLTHRQAEKVVRESIGDACYEILQNTAVFKDTEIGNNHLIKFMVKTLEFDILEQRRE